jgi:hypothetical protein
MTGRTDHRLHGQRRHRSDLPGRLAFIGIAQSAGFKLDEIKQLVVGVDGADGMAGQVRALSSRRLGEEALLERTQAMEAGRHPSPPEAIHGRDVLERGPSARVRIGLLTKTSVDEPQTPGCPTLRSRERRCFDGAELSDRRVRVAARAG